SGESVPGAIAVWRREGSRESADSLEEHLRTAPARVAAEIAAAPAPATPSPSSVAQAQPSTSATPPPTSPQITPVAPPAPTPPPAPAPSQVATSSPTPKPPSPTPPPTPAPPPPQVQRASAPPQPSAAPRVSQGTAFFVRPAGVLLPALPVAEGARSVAVACPGRDPAPAILASGTRNRDLVALKPSLAAPAYLTLHGARALLPGDPV